MIEVVIEVVAVIIIEVVRVRGSSIVVLISGNKGSGSDM